MTDYFTLLNLPPAFDLDVQALEQAYFARQRLCHPDRFVRKSPQERQQALLHSVEINAAYDALKKPLSRAQYLLHLQGIAVGTEADTVKPSAALLMETMEWRETVDEAGDVEKLSKLDNSLNALYMKTITEIARMYASQQWQAMAQETLKLGYVIKAQEALSLRRGKAVAQDGA